ALRHLRRCSRHRDSISRNLLAVHALSFVLTPQCTSMDVRAAGLLAARDAVLAASLGADDDAAPVCRAYLLPTGFTTGRRRDCVQPRSLVGLPHWQGAPGR